MTEFKCLRTANCKGVDTVSIFANGKLKMIVPIALWKLAFPRFHCLQELGHRCISSPGAPERTLHLSFTPSTVSVCMITISTTRNGKDRFTQKKLILNRKNGELGDVLNQSRKLILRIAGEKAKERRRQLSPRTSTPIPRSPDVNTDVYPTPLSFFDFLKDENARMESPTLPVTPFNA